MLFSSSYFREPAQSGFSCFNEVSANEASGGDGKYFIGDKFENQQFQKDVNAGLIDPKVASASYMNYVDYGLTMVGTMAFGTMANSNNWLRIGFSRDKGTPVFRIGWGAAERYAKDIEPQWLQDFNRYIRSINNGHFDIWRGKR